LSREGSVISNSTSLWEETNEVPDVPVLAEQPTTHLAIGGSIQTNSSSFFMGCIIRVAINDIEVPLSGLLQTSTSNGGFHVADSSGVVQHCNLCDLHECPDRRSCGSETLGEVFCHCEEQYLEVNGSCVLADKQLTPNTDNNSYYIIAGGALGAVLIFGVCIISIIVVCRKRQEKIKERRYSVNMNGSSRINRAGQSRRGNDYTSSILKKSSFSSSMNANYTIDSGERRSSISTYQEHAEDGDPETNSPMHQNGRVRHKSCASIESGIKMDEIEMSNLARRRIPTMEDSGHEVNSTDSNRTSVSDEVISSCNGRSPLPHARGASSMASPEHRMPRTPLTPKEKKVMIPLRPPSTSLSQSEYDEEEGIETESFHTRVSSSSGMGNSMQNQGRGSDTDSSKISDNSRWYHFPTNLDKDRDKLHLQSPLRPSYYPSHLNDDMQGGGACVYPSEMIPPMRHSPPSYSEHHDRSYATRGQPKSMHGGKSPLTSPLKSNMRTEHFATLPRKYENYPGHFTVGSRGEPRGNGVMYKSSTMRYNRGGNLNEARTSANERDYTPPSLFTRQYSDPKIPRNGTYCIPRNHDDPWSIHSRQMSDPQQSTPEQSQDSSVMGPPRGGGAPPPSSGRHMNAYSSNGTTTTNISSSSSSSTATGSSIIRHNLHDRQFYTLNHPKRVNFAPNTAPPATANANLQQQPQPGRSYSTGDAAAAVSNEPYQTLNSLSKIDPISNWDAQDRMKIAVDHMDPCHLLSGPCVPFEYVSTDPSVVESQLTVDESVMGGSHQMFDSRGGGEGMPNLLDPIDINMRLREDEIDSILTDSEAGICQVMNHFPSADCSSQYTATIVAGSSSTSGDSTPKDHTVFIMPPSQQSFDV